MKLKKVEILKYKSFSNNQTFQVEDDITILVGMNESGKTSALEAIGKTNYFQDDEEFKFSLSHDYPRKEKKSIDKSGIDPEAIISTYEIDSELLARIEKELGAGILTSKEFTVTTKYGNGNNWNVKVDIKKFIEHKTKVLGIASAALTDKLIKVNSIDDLTAVIEGYSDDKYITGLKTLEKYYRNLWKWNIGPIAEYIARIYLKPNRPKFLYYDEYYTLPSRISIEKLEGNELTDNEFKTAKAFFELADINTKEILEADNFENFIAELEATEAIISDELFNYWQTNKNLSITFHIDKIESTDRNSNTRIVEHVLDIRVKSKGVSLSLKNRSKGFNWFFSFLVWFKKIQEDHESNYILLLDEPGLNLHASAQADLLRFLEDLSKDYQIIYTTHSPFMISSENLNRVRTVLETDQSSIISDSIQEKDPNTLFPLQAALGYDIAQNLYVSKKNLLVEGVSDLIILTAMSSILESENRTFLRADVTIVPTGGLEKVATFISLLRGSNLETVCLLDSYTDAKGKAKMDSLIAEKIIHGKKVRFFHDFLDTYDTADLEDIFTKKDYLNLFNAAFPEHVDISEADLNPAINQIIIQINKHLAIARFNHYRPANQLTKMAVDATFFETTTLDNFEKVFKEINSLFV
ncbi:AAA family ATPase [Chryseobacterium kwangjuense]|uniref:AAA family ATPase n=1 Tax=Chryseobacterium kwangjuense TaxID=267125 RepID=A0A135W443_9FLAO|nr:AAA family ATPase [Chryseobacterium kwangjuense]KXH79701.1 AAA family ATPase [Chryseobacterium kwangjuense]